MPNEKMPKTKIPNENMPNIPIYQTNKCRTKRCRMGGYTENAIPNTQQDGQCRANIFLLFLTAGGAARAVSAVFLLTSGPDLFISGLFFRLKLGLSVASGRRPA
jgi:hypothetical protein